MFRNVGIRFQGLPKELKKLDTTKFKDKSVEIKGTEKSDEAKGEQETSLLDDPLFIHDTLESYRDELYNLNCSSDEHQLIMNSLEGELRNYYKEHGETGLKEHLDTFFEKLKNTYLSEATETEETEKTDEPDEDKTTTELKEFESILNSGEFNKEVNAGELIEQMNHYIDLLLNDLGGKNNYDDNYLGVLKQFIIANLSNEIIFDLDADVYQAVRGIISPDKSDGSVNLEVVLKNIKDIFNSLTETDNEDVLSKDMFWGDNNKALLIGYMIQDSWVKNKNELTIDDMQLADKFIEHLANKYGMAGMLKNEGTIDFSNLTCIDNNGDNNYLDEIYNELENFINDLKNNNFTTQKTTTNDDGSYKVDEYDTAGKLVHSTEYDSEGKIKHEYTINNDGSQSDKYYTYENGKLVQLQETIHYPDGKYTYIFTDGEGNLKEIQKVINNNEYGGTTFDTTFGDGRRSVTNLDKNDKTVNAIYYAADESLEVTREYKYNSVEPNFYNVITKNADGKIITDEVWESYEFENGCGSRLCMRSEYDDNGQIAKVIDYDYTGNAYLKDDNASITVMRENGIIRYIEITDADGNILISADINNDDVLQEQLDKAGSNELTQAVEMYKQIAKTQENALKLKHLGDNEAADRLLTELDKQKEKLAELLNIILTTATMESDLKNTVIEPPIVPPTKSDFIDRNGNFDELAYNAAMNNYSESIEEYHSAQAELNMKLAAVRRQHQKAELELKRVKDNIENIGNNAKFLTDIKEQINSTQDPDSKAILEKAYEELKQNIAQRQAIQELLEANYNELENTPIPTPPSKLDFVDKNGNFDELAYDTAMKQYKEARVEYDKKMNELNNNTRIYAEQDKKLNMQAKSIFSKCRIVGEYSQALDHLKEIIDNATDPEAKTALQEEYDNLKTLMNECIHSNDKTNEAYIQMMSLEVPVPPNRLDFTYTDENGNKVFDEYAYDKAFANYQQALLQYDKETVALQNKIDNLTNEGHKVQLQKESSSNTVRLIAEFTEALNKLQGEIDTATDSQVKVELEAKYEKLQKQMKQAIELSKQADEALIDAFTSDVLTLPSKLDFVYTDEYGNTVFDELAYDNAMKKFEQAKEEYEKQKNELTNKSTDLNIQLDNILSDAGINFEKGVDIQLTGQRQKLEAEGQRINNQRVMLSNQISRLYEEMASLQVPVPPNQQDFVYTDENGNRVLDELAYNSAMKQYRQAKVEYDNAQARLNQKIALYERQDKQLELELKALDNQRELLMTNQDMLRDVAAKISSDNLSQEDAAALKDIYGQLFSLVQNCIELNSELNQVRHEMFNLEIPTPPQKFDYMYTDENGNRVFDELAYDNAMALYEVDKAAYDSKINELNARTKSIQERDTAIYEQIQKLKAQADEI